MKSPCPIDVCCPYCVDAFLVVLESFAERNKILAAESGNASAEFLFYEGSFSALDLLAKSIKETHGTQRSKNQ